MARVGLDSSVAEGISDRLSEFYFKPSVARVTPRAANRRALARRLGVSVATVYEWLPSDRPKLGQRKAPRVPDPPHIIRMAERDRLSPAWLLTDEEPQLLGAIVPDAKVASVLLKHLIAELRSLGVPP